MARADPTSTSGATSRRFPSHGRRARLTDVVRLSEGDRPRPAAVADRPRPSRRRARALSGASTTRSPTARADAVRRELPGRGGRRRKARKPSPPLAYDDARRRGHLAHPQEFGERIARRPTADRPPPPHRVGGCPAAPATRPQTRATLNDAVLAVGPGGAGSRSPREPCSVAAGAGKSLGSDRQP
jgi:hypothetical protein